MKTIHLTTLLVALLPLYLKSNPPVTTVPFELVRNLIIVNAAVDGKTGLFILDTGAPEVILNDRYFKGILTGKKFFGINGYVTEKQIDFVRFKLGDFEQKTCVTILDFSALERMTGLDLFGVIGNDVFSRCELVLDYEFREVTVYCLDRKGARQAVKWHHRTPTDTLKFHLKGNMPFVNVMIGGRRLKMGLDSGASVCVIDKFKKQKLARSLGGENVDSLSSFGPVSRQAQSSILQDMVVGKLPCPPMKTLFISLDHFNENLSGEYLDGILGYEFLSAFRVAINFRKRKIYLWDQQTVEDQWASVRGRRERQ
jgi:hypothetical protein